MRILIEPNRTRLCFCDDTDVELRGLVASVKGLAQLCARVARVGESGNTSVPMIMSAFFFGLVATRNAERAPGGHFATREKRARIIE